MDVIDREVIKIGSMYIIKITFLVMVHHAKSYLDFFLKVMSLCEACFFKSKFSLAEIF